MAPVKSKLAGAQAPAAKKAKGSTDAPEPVPYVDATPKADDKVETVDRAGSSRFLTSVKYHINGTLASPLKSKAEVALQVIPTIFNCCVTQFMKHIVDSSLFIVF